MFEEQPGEEAPYERLLGDAMIGDGPSSLARTPVEGRLGGGPTQSLKHTTGFARIGGAVGGRKKLTRSSLQTAVGTTPDRRRHPDDGLPVFRTST